MSVFVACCAMGEEPAKGDYKSDFAKEEIGKDAAGLGYVVIGNGEFRITLDGDKKALELTPDPLDTCGFLFGPTEAENVTAHARVWGAASGRRYPVFALGLNGVGGYTLRLEPVRKTLELLKADETKQAVPYTWASGSWTVLALSVQKSKENAWLVWGKAWEFGKEEPKEWMVSFEDTEKPPAGRAALWAVPYSEEPIRIGELTVTKTK